MADVNRGDRPLSPHLQIYRMPMTAVMSIFHRATGVGLLVGAVLLIWWLLAAATGPEAFAVADAFLSGPIGGFLMLGCAFALSYHLLNGVRHLFWDAGYGFDLHKVAFSGVLVLIGSVVLTGAVWFIAQSGGV